MKGSTRASYWLITAILGMLLAVGGVCAQQKYPNKPIRLIVSVPPGGGTDVVARVMAQRITDSFGVPVVVDNRPGAAGMIGLETAVRANADGYTMVMLTGGHAANAALYKLPYDLVNDVAPIALIGETGFVATVNPAVRITNVKELILHSRANPGKLNFGTGGTGSITHLSIELFNQMAGVRMTHVPYKGGGPALNALLGGEIQLVMAGTPAVISHMNSNRLRGIAVTTAKRSNAVPNIPTVAETVPGYEVVQWFAVSGPKGLPKNIVARWNDEINRLVKLSEVKERMAADGMEPAGGSPERLREVLKRDVAKWQKVVKIANIKPDG